VIKKYLQFLKLNEGDLFDDENWDDEEEVPPEEEEEMVEDYNGYEISREEAIWCEYDGDWCHQDEVMWSEYEQIHFTPNNHDFVWIDGYAGGDYRHRDDLTFSERDGEHYLMDDAVWCEHEGDSCLYDDAVECDDGEYAFRENTVEDSEGRTQHEDDVTWDDKKEKYILNG